MTEPFGQICSPGITSMVTERFGHHIVMLRIVMLVPASALRVSRYQSMRFREISIDGERAPAALGLPPPRAGCI
jgi:hypothetical protein